MFHEIPNAALAQKASTDIHKSNWNESGRAISPIEVRGIECGWGRGAAIVYYAPSGSVSSRLTCRVGPGGNQEVN
ncbi:methylase of polypeptide subunit release factors [Paraburkholderia sp. GAS334]